MTDPFDRRRGAVPGRPVPIAPGVRRITCGNSSAMTFEGTQTYLIGTGEVAVIDPGPADPGHAAAIRDALGPSERITRILVSHSHADHSPGARLLAEATGAPVLAFGGHGAGMSATMRRLADEGAAIGGGEGADHAFQPDRALAEGDRVEGAGWSLAVLHTPGHLSNHLCFALEGSGVVFTGDTVMGWATTLVSPPEGDMAQFMASLRRLSARRDRLFLPGHGNPVADPGRMLRWQIDHREQRFRQIVEALQTGPADPAALAARIYTDLDPGLLPAAARNVLASLIALAEEGRVEAPGGLSAQAEFRLR